MSLEGRIPRVSTSELPYTISYTYTALSAEHDETRRRKGERKKREAAKRAEGAIFFGALNAISDRGAEVPYREQTHSLLAGLGRAEEELHRGRERGPKAPREGEGAVASPGDDIFKINVYSRARVRLLRGAP